MMHGLANCKFKKKYIIALSNEGTRMKTVFVMSLLQEATLSRGTGNPHGSLLKFLCIIFYKPACKNEKVQNFPKHCRSNFLLIDTNHFNENFTRRLACIVECMYARTMYVCSHNVYTLAQCMYARTIYVPSHNVCTLAQCMYPRTMYVRSHSLSVHNQFLSRFGTKSELEK